MHGNVFNWFIVFQSEIVSPVTAFP